MGALRIPTREYMSEALPYYDRTHLKLYSPSSTTTNYINTTDRPLYTKDPYTGCMLEHSRIELYYLGNNVPNSSTIKEFRSSFPKKGLYIITTFVNVARDEIGTSRGARDVGYNHYENKDIVKDRVVFVPVDGSFDSPIRLPHMNNLLVHTEPFKDSYPLEGVEKLAYYSPNTQTINATETGELVISARIIDNANVGKEYYYNHQGTTYAMLAVAGAVDGFYTQLFPSIDAINERESNSYLMQMPLEACLYTDDNCLDGQPALIYEHKRDAERLCSDHLLRKAEEVATKERERKTEDKLRLVKIETNIRDAELNRANAEYKAQVDIASYSRKATSDKLTMSAKIAVAIAGMTATALAFAAKSAIFSAASVAATPVTIIGGLITGVAYVAKKAWSTVRGWFGW